MKPTGEPKYLHTPIRWPRIPDLQTQIQQIKGASQPSSLSQTGIFQAASANMPKAVTGVVSTMRQAGSQRIVTISFKQNPDPFFQKVNIYFRQGSNPPILITSSPSSPVTFTLSKSVLASTIFVQSEGNWGPIPLSQSPSCALRLS